MNGWDEPRVFVYQNFARLNVLAAGRRSGKAYLALVELLTAASKGADKVTRYMLHTFSESIRALARLVLWIPVSMPSKHVYPLAALLIAAALASGQQQPDQPSNGQTELIKAYQYLAKKDYDTAINLFRQGLAHQPPNAAAVHKDLAYTLLKAGENAAARDEFAAALKLNPQDETAALEFSFLAFETGKPIEARRMFDRLRKSPNAATRQTAEQAFQNIDQPLAAGIARWQQAIAQSSKPNDLTMFSAHWELAHLAENRDDPALAAHEYEICRAIKPTLSELLLLLANAWQQIGRGEEAQAALLAASRSSVSRTAEQALELYGTRYPYPYEFLSALKLDPQNFNLRRELGYLYVAMQDKPKAIEQLEILVSMNPRDPARDELNALRGLRVRSPDVIPHAAPAAPAGDPKSMGIKSLALGYTKDAIKYLQQAHEANPHDAEVMLKLGWAYNQANDDKEAKVWFGLASKSDDKEIAAEARRAYHNLNGDASHTTVWLLPMYSTRWHDLFAYGQAKRTLPLPFLGPVEKFVSFYVSTRFDGDVRGAAILPGFNGPQYLSLDTFTTAVGASTRQWHRLTGWAEAGESIRYLNRNDVGLALPDYRGGVNYGKGFGHLLGAAKPGLYYETTADAVYVSRFSKDWLFYSQNRAGHTIPIGEKQSLQLLFNTNVVADSKRQDWANTIEIGPGLKYHPSFLPKNVYFSGDYLHGYYLMNTTRSNYTDLRLGFWYAVTK